MPSYTFECKKGHKTTRMFPISKFPNEIICKCGDTAKRIFVPSAGGFILKGEGFYTNDYKNKERKAADNKAYEQEDTQEHKRVMEADRQKEKKEGWVKHKQMN